MILATLHDQKNLQRFKDAEIDGVVIGIQRISTGQPWNLNKDEFKDFVPKCHGMDLKVFLNASSLFMEEELKDLEETLILCKELDVDGIYYSDEGLFWMAKQLDMIEKLIYRPETLMTNSMDIQTYLDFGLQAVCISHMLSLDEIQAMAVCPQKLEILIAGHFPILYSRRPLLTNYMHAIQSSVEIERKRYDLIESTREGRLPILQDEKGTYIYSQEPMQSVNEMPAFEKIGIGRYFIDSMFFDDEWTLRVVDAHKGQGSIEGSNRWYYQKSTLKKEEQQ